MCKKEKEETKKNTTIFENNYVKIWSNYKKFNKTPKPLKLSRSLISWSKRKIKEKTEATATIQVGEPVSGRAA